MSTSPPKAWLARQAYSLLLRLGTPLYLARIWSRGRVEPGYRQNWPQRLAFYGGRYRAQLKPSGPARPRVWVHAVSLGEARAAAPLVQALRAERPDMQLLLTHGTATGREAGRSLLREGDLQTWLPFDTPGAVRRFLRVHRPQVGVLMETEVWPNLQHAAHALGVPMVLANARLSDKSLRQGQRLAALMQPAAQALTLALAQTPDDARRLRDMGAPDVQVMGNVKFDMSPDPALLARGQAWRAASVRPLVLAASTREGEEAMLIDAWLREQATPGSALAAVQARLLLVPRHPQRFDEVATLLQNAGLRCARRSTWASDAPDAQALAADVWLGDSMGEMPAYYAAASVALLGGSFMPLGGQNLIEAAACGCPVLMGPSTFNFADAAEWSLAAGAGERVSDLTQAISRAPAYCDPRQYWKWAQICTSFAQTHQGAATAMARAIWSAVAGARQA